MTWCYASVCATGEKEEKFLVFLAIQMIMTWYSAIQINAYQLEWLEFVSMIRDNREKY